MMRVHILFALLIAVCLLAHPIAAQHEPAAADLLRAATDYLAVYAPRVSGVSLEEDYTLLDVSGGRVVNTHRTVSDVVIVHLNGTLYALRDVFTVDSHAVRERTPRVTALLAKPSQAAWDQAQRYVAEAARHFEDELILRLNTPTLALQFIAPDNQPKMTYKIDGRKKLQGVETVGLRFQEQKKPAADYILATRGKSLATGRLWVDPASGRIHRTEFATLSTSEFARVAVDYAYDKALDLWLPASMRDTYEITEVIGAGMKTPGGGSPNQTRWSFECRASYTNARLTPINMAVTQLK